MAGDEQKLDSAMAAAYRAWLEERVPDAGISVMLFFQGDIAPLEELGFETHSNFGTQALGVVYFKDVAALSANPDLLWMRAGEPRRPDLDTAVNDIRARAASLAGGVPSGGLWHADVDTGALVRVRTGKDVIVAVIDTGIDFTHPMFVAQYSPTVTTRILRIWDQGLTPASVTDCPPKRLIASANTYGVEYDDGDIEGHLNGGTPLAHRDCIGHGTHVAGIAAGGTNFGLFGDASKVGVAPEADIIAVKYIDVPDTIRARLPDGSVGQPVLPDARFVDAVLYCLRTARELGKPVVINMSFSDSSKPGDGLDLEARWLDGVLDPTHAPSDDHFPTGAVVVKSSGNDGRGDGRVVRIEVPATGEIIVPFELLDQRDGATTDWQNCSQELYKPQVGIHFWYRRPAAAPLSVAFAVRFPYGPGPFSADVVEGRRLERGINPVYGTPRNDIAIAFAPDRHGIRIDASYVAPAVPHPAGGPPVQRQRVRFAVAPKYAGGALSYHDGVYEVRIKAPAGTVVFAKCDRHSWNDASARFRLSDTMRDGSPRPVAGMTKLIESTTLDSYGQHVITVASYADLADPATSTVAHGIGRSSSRGPLRDYSDPPRPPPFVKPDIAAPGVKINSAESRHVEGFWRWPWWYFGNRFDEKTGTSMAAPMIAGVVALCFERNPNLNVTEARTALSAAPRAGAAPAAAPASTRAYGAGMVDAITSHTNTP